MKRGPDEIGLFRRLAVMLLGLMLAGSTFLLVSIAGWLIFLAGLGVVELAMALRYRSRRHSFR